MIAKDEIVDLTLVKYKRAWLVTWDWMGDHAKVDDSFVALMDGRYLGKTIKRFVELIYVNKKLSFHEQLAFAKKRAINPYPAQFGTLAVRAKEDLGLPDKVEWEGQIICGSNPWLFARTIHDVVAYIDKDGREHLKWKERSNPFFEGGNIVSNWQESEIIRY